MPEGYLINQFISMHTNKRTDQWGGSYENRIRLPIEIIERTREAVGRDFILIYRLSMLDPIPDGSDWSETVQLAKAVERAGATIINTGIGWHEARVPTIATSVPRGAFAWVTKKMKGEVGIPLVTTNRINRPEVAELILADGCGHGVDGAPAARGCRVRGQGRAGPCRRDQYLHRLQPGVPRPRVQEPDRVVPAEPARVPRDGTEIHARRAAEAHRGGRRGPAACSTVLAQRGHQVDLFDSAAEIGGQFNMAKRIPGKEEFHEALSFRPVELTGVNLHLNRRVDASDLIAGGYDEIVLATGVAPRDPKIPGRTGRTCSATSTCSRAGSRSAGVSRWSGRRDRLRCRRVPGAGGRIAGARSGRVEGRVGVTDPAATRGGVTRAQVTAPAREVTLLQRSAPLGKPARRPAGFTARR